METACIWFCDDRGSGFLLWRIDARGGRMTKDGKSKGSTEQQTGPTGEQNALMG
jgi:hypothetical protein